MGSASNVGGAPPSKVYCIDYHCLFQATLTFEADPIGRRLERLPKKGINMNFNIIFKGIFNGAPGAPGVN